MKDAPIKLTREDAPIFAPSEVTAETEVHVEVSYTCYFHIMIYI